MVSCQNLKSGGKTSDLGRLSWLMAVNDVNLIFKLLTIARIEGFNRSIVSLQL
jgi:hypothetical protein